VEKLGADNSMIVRLHRTGTGLDSGRPGMNGRTHTDIPGVATVDLRNPSAFSLSPAKPDPAMLARFGENLKVAVEAHASRHLSVGPHWLEMAVDAESGEIAVRNAAEDLRHIGVSLSGRARVDALPDGFAVRFNAEVPDAGRIEKVFGSCVMKGSRTEPVPAFPAFAAQFEQDAGMNMGPRM
jgi:hypothetical protein